MTAPASRAAAATPARQVSTDTRASWRRTISRITGTTRARSSAAVMGSDPGREDWPPTSIRSAPSASIVSARASACSGSQYSPPSENESGVTFKTPMMRVRGGRAPVRPSAGPSGPPARRERASSRASATGRSCGWPAAAARSRPGRSAAPPHKTSTVSPAAPGASTHQPPAAWCSQAWKAAAVSRGTAISLQAKGCADGEGAPQGAVSPMRASSSQTGVSAVRGNRRANIGGVLSRPRAAGVKPFPAPPRAPAWPA